jgi:hypothetical protein
LSVFQLFSSDCVADTGDLPSLYMHPPVHVES